jgi:hypothetical protein
MLKVLVKRLDAGAVVNTEVGVGKGMADDSTGSGLPGARDLHRLVLEVDIGVGKRDCRHVCGELEGLEK